MNYLGFQSEKKPALLSGEVEVDPLYVHVLQSFKSLKI